MRFSGGHITTKDTHSPEREASGGRTFDARAGLAQRATAKQADRCNRTGNLGDHKSVGDEVWEARMTFGAGYRLYLAKTEGKLWCCWWVVTNLHRPKTSKVRADTGASIYRRSIMARRSRDWNEGLAEDLKDPAFAREFLAAAVEDGIPLQHALGKVIRATGVKEFADRVDMPSSNLLRAIHPRHNPTQETLEKLLKPFGLRIGLAPIIRRGRRAA